MKKLYELDEIIGFIEQNRKTIKPTGSEWGYDCLSINDVYELLTRLGCKITKEDK